VICSSVNSIFSDTSHWLSAISSELTAESWLLSAHILKYFSILNIALAGVTENGHDILAGPSSSAIFWAANTFAPAESRPADLAVFGELFLRSDRPRRPSRLMTRSRIFLLSTLGIKPAPILESYGGQGLLRTTRASLPVDGDDLYLRISFLKDFTTSCDGAASSDAATKASILPSSASRFPVPSSSYASQGWPGSRIDQA